MSSRRATETIRGDRDVHRGADRVGTSAYESNGDVYFRVARFPSTGVWQRRGRIEVEEQEPNPLQGGSARLRALEGATSRARTRRGTHRGALGRPGWHIECSAMAEKNLGPGVRDPRGRPRPASSRITRTRSRSRGRSDRPFARIWMHNGMLEFSGEEMHKSLGNDVSLRERARPSGAARRCSCSSLTGHWRKPLDYSDDADAAASARADRFREVFRNPHEPAPDERGSGSPPRSRTTSTHPAALAVMHEWRDHESLRRALGVFGLESLADADEPPSEVGRARRATTGCAGGTRLRGSRPLCARSSRRRAGKCVTSPDGYRLVQLR